jgi:hypothetical protein
MEVEMQVIRFEPRHMCSDLVKVRLHDGADPEEFVANLEEISPSGACLLLEAALLDGASIEVICSTCRLKGKVRYCRFVEIGYVVGVAFNERQSWSRERYEPQNLLELPDD